MKIFFENEQLTIDFKEYQNGNLAVLLYDEYGLPYEKLSINTEFVLDKDEFVVNHDLIKLFHGKLLISIFNSNLFEDTGKVVNYGYCRNVPIWRRKKDK